jgi:hypothetical protein
LSTQVPPRAQRLYALWTRLPDTPLTEAALESEILRLLDGTGREADASALKHLLCGAQAVICTRDESGVRFTKADEFPIWEHDTGPGSRSWDEHLRELSEQQQADDDRVAAEVAANAPQNRQRAELDAHVRAVVGEVIDARIDELRRQLPMLVRQHIDQTELRARIEARFDQTQAAWAVRDATGRRRPAEGKDHHENQK